MPETPDHPFAPSLRAPPAAPRLRAVDGGAPVHLTVMLRPRDLPARIGPVLSREDYARLHATPADVMDRLAEYARANGLAVDHADAGQHVMRLSGTYDAAGRAFAPENLAVYGAPGATFVARDGHLSVPADLARDLVAVMGFDQRPIARPYIRPLLARAVTSYDPAALARRYGFPTGVTGAGQTIAIIELGGGYRDAEMAAYFRAKGIARTGTLEAVAVGGAGNAPGRGDGADGEVQLDIQVAGSVASGAHLAVYFASNQGRGFADAVTAAVHDRQRAPSVLSISWGGPESGWPQQDLDALNQAFQVAATLGITVCCASGDSGAVDGAPDGQPTVDFPAASPYVLGCGGTRLPPQGPETAWNDRAAGGASGGGYSARFAKPEWQSGNSGSGRGVPDVAGDADPATGYNVSVDGQDGVVGGTSAVAPLWAGLFALCNEATGGAAGFVNPRLYAAPSAMTDITEGDNDGYRAGPGWDPVTGLGSPRGEAVLAALRPAPTV